MASSPVEQLCTVTVSHAWISLINNHTFSFSRRQLIFICLFGVISSNLTITSPSCPWLLRHCSANKYKLNLFFFYSHLFIRFWLPFPRCTAPSSPCVWSVSSEGIGFETMKHYFEVVTIISWHKMSSCELIISQINEELIDVANILNKLYLCLIIVYSTSRCCSLWTSMYKLALTRCPFLGSRSNTGRRNLTVFIAEAVPQHWRFFHNLSLSLRM